MAAEREHQSTFPEVIPDRVAAALDAEGLALLNDPLGRLKVVEAENASLRAEVAELRRENQELRARLGKDSTNSSRPPSSDPPERLYKRAKREPSGRKAGGQPGHKGVTREMLPPERVTAVIGHHPATCSGCGADLSSAPQAGEPVPHQVIELPEIRPEVIEHRLHAARCESCGTVTRAELPPEARWCTGPRLTAFAALLCGRFRISREETADLLWSALGVPISKATVQACCERVSAAIAEPVSVLVNALRHLALVHLDETGWKLGRARLWLWVAVATTFTVFAVHLRRSRDQLVEWFGSSFHGVVHSDRWRPYEMFPPDHRQLCWAHLLRDLQAIIDAAGAGKDRAEKTLLAARTIFVDWRLFKQGSLDRAELQRRTSGFRTTFHTFCADGSGQDADRCWRALGSGLIRLWPAVFRFLDIDGVEPTNNAAEQAIRPAVLWRRSSQGSRSEAGSTFVARILTVAATCRRQGRHPLAYLTEAVVNYTHGRPAPALRSDIS